MIIFLKKLLAICFVFRYNEEALKAKSAAVAEPADAYDSKSYGEIHMGSSPISGTSFLRASHESAIFFIFLWLQWRGKKERDHRIDGRMT